MSADVVQMSFLNEGDELPQIVTPRKAPGPRLTIAERFAAFHELNPHVYAALRTLALRLHGTGRRRGSINQLFEVLRYEYSMRTQGGDGYKLNDNFRALYARMLMENEQDLAGWFETRELRSRQP
jgi:hypothetical protein